MGYIIWIIIIIGVVLGEVNKQKRKQGTRPNVPRTQQRPMQGYQAKQQVNRQRPVQNNQTLQQNNQTPQQNTLQSKDILSRAAANVQENDGDLLQMQMTGTQMMADAHALAGAIDIGETSELMREVNNLMITGYQADLPFERDFVAEGVEMLNRFELPTEG